MHYSSTTHIIIPIVVADQFSRGVVADVPARCDARRSAVQVEDFSSWPQIRPGLMAEVVFDALSVPPLVCEEVHAAAIGTSLAALWPSAGIRVGALHPVFNFIEHESI